MAEPADAADVQMPALRVQGLAPNLAWDEVLRGSGYDSVEDLPQDVADSIALVAQAFQLVRDEMDTPISVLAGGGVRSPEMNKRVGGAKKSQHLAGRALDIRLSTDRLTLQAYDLINEYQRSGRLPAGGLALYVRADKSVRFCHFDIRGRLARWNGGARKSAALS